MSLITSRVNACVFIIVIPDFIRRYINRLQAFCKNVIRVGSLMDGGKEICIDEQFEPKPPCLVYSFGLIDIEGDEWYSIPQMISSGALDDVKQISMETHYIKRGKQLWGSHPIPAADELYALRLLYDKGFRIFMRERNLNSK
ncbi:hypothetical protein MAR_033628, partial [Mya arenaria]